ncbi:MAG TPA: hypothetical protein VMM37_07085, partial [Bacteroidota bacterium]|nr:hypothetical protein [Bacteroidota bacterium]
LYNGRELAELRRRMEALKGRCRDGMIVCNNTTGGKAVATAFQIAAMLRQGAGLPIPPMAYRAFPVLQEIAQRSEAGATLFDQADLRTAV